jgi:hypothetical protein
MFGGQIFISHSIGKMATEDDGVDSDEAIVKEVLNTFTIPGFPSSKLEFKFGIPVILDDFPSQSTTLPEVDLHPLDLFFSSKKMFF